MKLSSNAEEILQRHADRCGVAMGVIGEYADDIALAMEDRIGKDPNLYLLVTTCLLTRVANQCEEGQEVALDTAVRLIDIFTELADEDHEEDLEEEDASDEEED